MASEILERLDIERIRPELGGLSRPGLGSALTMLEQAHREGSWRALSDEKLAERCAKLFVTVNETLRTRPLKPQRGEIGRVVAILRRMPKQTVTRFVKAWNPILLRLVIAFNLRTLRWEADDLAPPRTARLDERAARALTRRSGRTDLDKGRDAGLRSPGPGALRPQA